MPRPLAATQSLHAGQLISDQQPARRFTSDCMLLIFECCIQVKYIEVSNPASKPIAYTARLEGHSDFALEAPTIRIEAKGSTRIAVQCKSSTTNPQVCEGVHSAAAACIRMTSGAAKWCISTVGTGQGLQLASCNLPAKSCSYLKLQKSRRDLDCSRQSQAPVPRQHSAMVPVRQMQQPLSAADVQAHSDQQAGWQCASSYHGVCPQS